MAHYWNRLNIFRGRVEINMDQLENKWWQSICNGGKHPTYGWQHVVGCKPHLINDVNDAMVPDHLFQKWCSLLQTHVLVPTNGRKSWFQIFHLVGARHNDIQENMIKRRFWRVNFDEPSWFWAVEVDGSRMKPTRPAELILSRLQGKPNNPNMNIYVCVCESL